MAFDKLYNDNYWEYSSNNFMIDEYDHFITDNKYINNINENVLYTYQIDSVIKLFDNVIDCHVENVKYDVLTFWIKCSTDTYKLNRIINRIENISNMTGWIISIIKMNNNFITFDELKNLCNIDNKHIKFEIFIRPKRDVRINYKYTNKLSIDIYKQDYLYHITDEKYLNKIFKNGLITRNKNKLGNYPECIHLFTHLTHKGPVCKIKKIDDNYTLVTDPKMNIDNPVLLKINAGWCKNYNIKFSYDPTASSNCVITYNSIPPNLISVVDEDEYEKLFNKQEAEPDYSKIR